MFYNYNKRNTSLARELRKHMTPEERHLWYDFLKRLPMTVHRQKNVGDFIVDFLIDKAYIIIEIDGRQHKLPEHEEADKQRDRELNKLGFVVLRYSNEDIRDRFNAVCEDIMKRTNTRAEDLKPIVKKK